VARIPEFEQLWRDILHNPKRRPQHCRSRCNWRNKIHGRIFTVSTTQFSIYFRGLE
ncbi:hypothetical protein DOY81_015349, partial [Sarcophaga bullata]